MKSSTPVRVGSLVSWVRTGDERVSDVGFVDNTSGVRFFTVVWALRRSDDLGSVLSTSPDTPDRRGRWRLEVY